MNPWRIKYLFLAMVALMTAMFSGCASTSESENASERPWNQPRGWENGLPSSLYENR